MRQVLLGIALLSISCGSKSPPPEQATPPAEPAEPAGPAEAAGPTEAEPDTPVAAACKNLVALHAKTPCEPLTRSNFVPENCEKDLDSAKVPPQFRANFDSMLGCVAEAGSCRAFETCMKSFAEAAASQAASGRTCGEARFGQINLDADQAAKRYGQGVTKLSAAPTSMDQPIEVCGIGGEQRWLFASRCDDGSAPFTDPEKVGGARAGSMGSGGRCASTIDKYEVKCPEKTYEVFMDMYMCGPGESL
jgi:hypothetical protein